MTGIRKRTFSLTPEGMRGPMTQQELDDATLSSNPERAAAGTERGRSMRASNRMTREGRREISRRVRRGRRGR